MTVAHGHLKPILLAAYPTGVRKGEILNLMSDLVDLKRGLNGLRPEDTKARKGRTIPVTKELSEAFENATIYLEESGQRVLCFSRMRGSASSRCGGLLKSLVEKPGLTR